MGEIKTLYNTTADNVSTTLTIFMLPFMHLTRLLSNYPSFETSHRIIPSLGEYTRLLLITYIKQRANWFEHLSKDIYYTHTEIVRAKCA